MTDFSQFELGKTAETVALENIEDHRLAALALAQQARRKIHIFSSDLEAPLYDNLPFATALVKLILRSQHSRILILVQDSGRVAREGHRVIELARQFPSYVHIRRPPEEYLDHPEAFLIVDDIGVLHRRLNYRYEGTVNFAAARQARTLQQFFSKVWDVSVPDPELRQLYI